MNIQEKIIIGGNMAPRFSEILTKQALDFLAGLHDFFEPRRQEILQARKEMQSRFDVGERPDFALESADIRNGDWRIDPIPADLQDRRVEITGPVDRKMIVNALNSGASCYMADFEDSSTPSWRNMMEGQINLHDAVQRQIDFTDPRSGKKYALQDAPLAVLIIRPRGWHMVEKHVMIHGAPVSASLFDFALYLFHNHHALREAGSGHIIICPRLKPPPKRFYGKM